MYVHVAKSRRARESLLMFVLVSGYGELGGKVLFGFCFNSILSLLQLQCSKNKTLRIPQREFTLKAVCAKQL